MQNGKIEKYLNGSQKYMNNLILYNDDYHSDDEFLNAIWIATGYDVIQCEQFLKLIRLKQFVIIKQGNIIEELLPMMETLQIESFKTRIL